MAEINRKAYQTEEPEGIRKARGNYYLTKGQVVLLVSLLYEPDYASRPCRPGVTGAEEPSLPGEIPPPASSPDKHRFREDVAPDPGHPR
jgi:hypothetical protein